MDTQISWRAALYDHREHGADWYWAVSIITISLAVSFFIVGNALLSLILLIGVGTLLFHVKNSPEMLECGLSNKGIRVGEKLYLWETLESFWILDEIDTEKEYASARILLTSKKNFMPHIVVSLGDDAPTEQIYHVLSQMLPEEHSPEPLVDKVARKLGI